METFETFDALKSRVDELVAKYMEYIPRVYVADQAHRLFAIRKNHYELNLNFNRERQSIYVSLRKCKNDNHNRMVPFTVAEHRALQAWGTHHPSYVNHDIPFMQPPYDKTQPVYKGELGF
jgi:hypothetical protein